MYNNAAYKLEQLVRGTSYKPVWVNTAPNLKDPTSGTTNMAASSVNGSGYYDHRLISKILVVKNSMSNLFVRIYTVGSSISYTDIPCAAFIVGNEFEILLDSYTIVDSGGSEQTGQDSNFILVGYLAKNIPLDYE